MHETSAIVSVTQLTFILLFVAAIVAIFAKKLKFPLSVALVVVGVAVGMLARTVDSHEGLLAGAATAIREIQLSPELIFFIFLPTLIFESAYNLEVRKVLKDLGPIMMLAAPGLLISTALVAFLISWTLGLDLLHAAVFGALISATDPVAVVALFREVGAPKRLVTLVEGESLFNDATAVVVFSILVGLVQGHHATVPGAIGNFAYVFLGGIAVGVVMGVLFAKIIEHVQNDEIVEISLTIVLAYLSFIIADHSLHVSGVMAVVAAGMTLGSYGSTKLSRPAIKFMHSFWECMAFLGNAMIFLLVGLYLPRVLEGVSGGVGLAKPIFLAVAIVFLARALVVFGLTPLLPRIKLTEPINYKYQTVMFWGGLRGAIALALALSLVGLEGLPSGVAEFIVALSAGVVLFTMLVNALSMKRLVQYFGLDRESPAERILKASSMLDVQREIEKGLADYRSQGVLFPRAVDHLVSASRRKQEEIAQVLASEDLLSPEEKLNLHRAECLGIEKNHYMRLFAEGNLSESATRDLVSETDSRAERVRRGEAALPPRPSGRLGASVAGILRGIPGFRGVAQRLEIKRVAEIYESARGRYLAAAEVLKELRRRKETNALSDELLTALNAEYNRRSSEAEGELDEMAEQFPEFVHKVQELVGTRISLNTEQKLYSRLHDLGVLTDKLYEGLKLEVEARFHSLEKRPVGELNLEPAALLASVPLFSGLGEEALQAIAGYLRSRSCVGGEHLFEEGEQGDTMFLIGRGIVKVWRGEGPEAVLIATLSAGDFVGEMALVRPAPRTASAQTTSVASLLELRKADLDRVIRDHPEVGETLENAYRERMAELADPTAFSTV